MPKISLTKKIFLGVFFIFIAFIAIGIVLLKTSTGSVAQTADNLRPIIGNNNVILLEKIYFNISDKISGLTKNNSNIIAPEFSEIDVPNSTISGSLNLTPVPFNQTFKKLPHEGEWRNKAIVQFPNQEVMAYTFVRPDPDRPYSIVTLLQIDMQKFRLGAVAGKKQPGGPVGNPGPGVIPQDLVDSGKLVAAFDGGFQYRDGEYGMIVGDKTYLPLQKDTGTLIGNPDGSLRIINYTGQDLGQGNTFVRQNCPILVENGNISILNEANKKLWGRTPTSSIFTWRSGLGLTETGNLIYAVGNNLDPLSLSTALKMAGAYNAIQLDINPFWVRFNFFIPQGNSYTTKTLTKDLFNGGKDYLTGYDKDFFYLYLK